MQPSVIQKIFLLMAGLIIAPAIGCKKFVQVDPPITSITGATVYSNNSSAAAVMTGIYDQMEGNSSGLSNGLYSLSVINGLMSDELKYYLSSSPYAQCYTNSLNSQIVLPYWKEIYNEIFQANSVIEGVSKSSSITPQIKQQLIGEAKFMRAFLHFYATNLYGNIPIVTTTDYQTNNSISRSTQITVYQQIIQDLKDAQSALTSGYVDANGISTVYRIRPNQGAATALLARVYLYYADLTKDVAQYKNAEDQATLLINNSTTYGLVTNLKNVFLGANTSQNNSEAIWQLQPISTGYNTYDGNLFILTSAPGTGQFNFSLSSNVINAFENSDGRFTNWVGSFTSNGITYYYPYKYKIGTSTSTIAPTEYTMVLRLAEQYLIRAEARTQNGDISGANADLNVIRRRAGLADYAGAIDKTSILKAILHERQIEFFSEWGHRWFDLSRTGNLNSVMGNPGNICQNKGGVWDSNHSLLPIPYTEFTYNSNLTQNPGY